MVLLDRAFRGSARWGLMGVLSLSLFTACTTTSTPGGPRAGGRSETPSAPDPADRERLAAYRLELASGYFSRGQPSTALGELQQVLAIRPDLAEAHNLKGLIYASMNEPAQAEESFRQALRLNARDADTMHNLGWFYCQQKRFKDAQTQFDAAVAVPGYPAVARTLMAAGVCQARNGQWSEAERSLSRAYEFDPANPSIAVNLGEVLYRRGELERARFYVRRVNANDDMVNAQTLWLALRIEQKLGQAALVSSLGQQLRQRFPQSPEALLYEKGRWDE